MAEEIYKFRIPEEVYGQVIDGVDLQILSSDSVRIIEAYIKQDGQLSEIQIRVLRQCERELQSIIPKVDDKAKEYFLRVQTAVLEVVSKI